MPWKKNFLKNCKLYLILDTEVCDYRRLLMVLKKAVASGVDIVQLRDKKGEARDILEFTAAALKVTKDKVPYIINDRVDLALAGKADGVHVGQEDIRVPLVRKLAGRKLIIGASCQSLSQALQAQREGADYIGFGSVFKTQTKPDRRPMKLAKLRRVLKTVRVPVFPIGGINAQNIGTLIRHDAERVAVCRDLCLAWDTGREVRELRRQLER